MHFVVDRLEIVRDQYSCVLVSSLHIRLSRGAVAKAPRQSIKSGSILHAIHTCISTTR